MEENKAEDIPLLTVGGRGDRMTDLSKVVREALPEKVTPK